ncbi:MAG: CPBP family intramembrane metalloprotease [bacterium]|nr:CPBP family intramembrane metalloprotease [bacterium]
MTSITKCTNSNSLQQETFVPWGITEALLMLAMAMGMERIVRLSVENIFFTNITLAQFGNSRTNLLASLQWATLGQGTIVFSFIIISLTYLIRIHHHTSLQTAGWNFHLPRHWFPGAISIGITFGIFEFYAVKWILNWIGSSIPPEWMTLHDPDYPLLSGAIIYALLGIILFPIAEEYLFRGVMYQAFRKHFGTSFSVVVASLLFLLWHYHKVSESPVLAIPIFAGGVIKCLVYERSRSLIPPIIIHSLSNTTLFLFVLLQK